MQDTDGSPIRWNVIELLHAGLLEMPVGNDGEVRQLNGHYVDKFLSRQPEWQQLKRFVRSAVNGCGPIRSATPTACAATGRRLSWVQFAAMGHNLEAHGRAYRWESQETTAAAFASVFAD